MVISNEGPTVETETSEKQSGHSAFSCSHFNPVYLHVFLPPDIFCCRESCFANSAHFALVLKPSHLFLTLNKGDISAQISSQ